MDSLNLDSIPQDVDGVDLELAGVAAEQTVFAIREILADAREQGRGTDPNVLAFIAGESFGFTDSFPMPGAEALQEAGYEIACRKGCSFCCHLEVKISWAEVWATVIYLVDHRSIEDLEALLVRVESVAQQVKDMDATERCASKIPCSLLDTTAGECSVYDARPHACRGYNSVDASICERGFGEPGASIPMEALQQSLHAGTCVGILAGLREVNPGLGRFVELNFGVSKTLPAAIAALKADRAKAEEAS